MRRGVERLGPVYIDKAHIGNFKLRRIGIVIHLKHPFKLLYGYYKDVFTIIQDYFRYKTLDFRSFWGYTVTEVKIYAA